MYCIYSAYASFLSKLTMLTIFYKISHVNYQILFCYMSTDIPLHKTAVIKHLHSLYSAIRYVFDKQKHSGFFL